MTDNYIHIDEKKAEFIYSASKELLINTVNNIEWLSRKAKTLLGFTLLVILLLWSKVINMLSIGQLSHKENVITTSLIIITFILFWQAWNLSKATFKPSDVSLPGYRAECLLEEEYAIQNYPLAVTEAARGLDIRIHKNNKHIERISNTIAVHLILTIITLGTLITLPIIYRFWF